MNPIWVACGYRSRRGRRVQERTSKRWSVRPNWAGAFLNTMRKSVHPAKPAPWNRSFVIREGTFWSPLTACISRHQLASGRYSLHQAPQTPTRSRGPFLPASTISSLIRILLKPDTALVVGEGPQQLGVPQPVGPRFHVLQLRHSLHPPVSVDVSASNHFLSKIVL